MPVRIPIAGRTNIFAIVDEEDARLVSTYRWHLLQRESTAYAYSARHRLLMHRLILNPPDGLLVDHINGNGLDNRRCNLRICDRCQNQWNRRPRNPGLSRFKGVWWDTERKRWAAVITCRKRHYKLGHFNSEVEAALAYDRAARELFGQFALLNLPSIIDAAK